jgi:TatD family-associated radical SAM protein
MVFNPGNAGSVAAAAARPGVAYVLGRTLYLSMTNRSNAATIVETRGPSFKMPADSFFRPYRDPPHILSKEPEAEELAEVVDMFYDKLEIVGMGENDPGVVFAGMGEPLLRMEQIRETIEQVHEVRHGVPFRVSTNGLFPASVAVALADAGISKATVALATADPGQYTELMRPEGGDHSTVCGFIASLAEAGVEVEATAVERPGVDVAAARKLAEALGASGFRTRTYHP